MKIRVCILLFCFFSLPFLSNAQMKGALEQMRGVLPGVEAMDHEKLIELLSDAIKQYPEQPAQYNNRGIAKYALMEYDSALVDLNTTLKLSPNYADAYYNRGLIKLKLKDYTGAIEDFQFILKNDTADYYTLYNNALANYLAGSKEQALADLEKTLKLKPNFEWALCNIGVIKNELGKQAEAILHFTKAIEINGKDADYYSNRGQAYLKTGNNTLACEDLKKSAGMGSTIAAELAKSCE